MFCFSVCVCFFLRNSEPIVFIIFVPCSRNHKHNRLPPKMRKAPETSVFHHHLCCIIIRVSSTQHEDIARNTKRSIMRTRGKGARAKRLVNDVDERHGRCFQSACVCGHYHSLRVLRFFFSYLRIFSPVLCPATACVSCPYPMANQLGESGTRSYSTPRPTPCFQSTVRG